MSRARDISRIIEAGLNSTGPIVGTTGTFSDLLTVDKGTISADTIIQRIRWAGNFKGFLEFYSDTGLDWRGRVGADNGGALYLHTNGGGGIFMNDSLTVTGAGTFSGNVSISNGSRLLVNLGNWPTSAVGNVNYRSYLGGVEPMLILNAEGTTAAGRLSSLILAAGTTAGTTYCSGFVIDAGHTDGTASTELLRIRSLAGNTIGTFTNAGLTITGTLSVSGNIVGPVNIGDLNGIRASTTKLYFDGGYGAYIDCSVNGGHGGGIRIYGDDGGAGVLSGTFLSTGLTLPGTLTAARAVLSGNLGNSFTATVNSDWALTVTNTGSTDAHGLYVNVGASSTGVLFRVDKNGAETFTVKNDKSIYFTGWMGIGASTAETALHVSMSSSSPQLILQRTTSSTGKYSFGANGNELHVKDEAQALYRLKIDSAGNWKKGYAYYGTFPGAAATVVASMSGVGTALRIVAYGMENNINCSYGEWIAVWDGTAWTMNLVSQVLAGNSHGYIVLSTSGDNLQIRNNNSSTLGVYYIRLETLMTPN